MSYITLTAVSVALIVAVLAAWDIAKRYLALKSSEQQRAVDAIGQLVERAEAVEQRNKAALEAFLTQIYELTKFVERSRREAEGAALQSSRGVKR